MKIAIAAPVRPGSTSGNDVTAQRWSDRLTELGHQVVTVAVEPDGRFDATELSGAELLVALHARRSAGACRHWVDDRPNAPLVVALTGTDLYVDLPEDAGARRSINDADALIVLQSAALDRLAEIAPRLEDKAAVIHQSVSPPAIPRRVDRSVFRVVVLAHLREVKDPLLCARAATHLPADSTVVVDHGGAAHTDEWRDEATSEAESNPRYRWHGPLERDAAQKLLRSASVLACTSLVEGGANVVTEAIAAGVPVVGTDIDGNRGLLGDDYPGLVPVGDDTALAALLRVLETDDEALAALQRRVDSLLPITEVATERDAWAELLASLGA